MKRKYAMEIIHMSFIKIYQYKSVTFEWHDYMGPTMLRRKDYKPRSMRSISLRQWGEFVKWYGLSEAEREEYRLI
jgi:hypothetical protein